MHRVGGYSGIERAGIHTGGKGERCIELEVTRYGGHNEVVGWTQVALAVRRAFERRGRMKPGLDVE